MRVRRVPLCGCVLTGSAFRGGALYRFTRARVYQLVPAFATCWLSPGASMGSRRGGGGLLAGSWSHLVQRRARPAALLGAGGLVPERRSFVRATLDRMNGVVVAGSTGRQAV